MQSTHCSLSLRQNQARRKKNVRRFSGTALAAALIPLGAVAMPAQAVTQVTTTAETFADNVSSSFDTQTSSTGYTAVSAGDVNLSDARANGNISGLAYVKTQIGNHVDTGSGGVATSFAILAATPGDVIRQADASTVYSTELSSGNHKFFFHVNPQILQAAFNTHDPEYGNQSFLEMIVSVGQGPGEEILYHWNATLTTSGVENIFDFNTLVVPSGAAVPSFSDFSDASEAYFYSPGYDVGLELGYRPAGTQLNAKFISSSYSGTTSATDAFSAYSLFGDPFGPGDTLDPPFTVVTTQVSNPVPEPASLTLLASALGVVTLTLRRRKQA